MIEDVKFQKFCSETLTLMRLWSTAEEDGCRRRFLQTRARRWPAMLLRLHLALPDDHANDDERCSVHAIPMHTRRW